MTSSRPRVGLFATCLVDLYRPSVGFAAAALLERTGFDVDVPRLQVCCGQPAYNSGDRRGAQAVARRTVAQFEGFDYVVAPSGSCAGTIRVHYPTLFADDPEWAPRAAALAAKTWELVAFLHEVAPAEKLDAAIAARWDGTVTYHDSCSSLRELGIAEAPRALLRRVAGLELRELEGTEVCCGFGGTFCVKYPEVSAAMVDAKADAVAATGADTVLAGDLGCLLNIAGRLARRGIPVEARHVAEVLAGGADGPAIGQAVGGAVGEAWGAER